MLVTTRPGRAQLASMLHSAAPTFLRDAIADRGGNGDQWLTQQPADDRSQRAAISATTMTTSDAAYFADPLLLASTHLPRQCRRRSTTALLRRRVSPGFLGDPEVGRAGRHDRHDTRNLGRVPCK